MMIMTMTMMIAFKGAYRDFFYTLLTAPRTVSNIYAQVTWEQSCATHRAIITCSTSCAAWYEGTAQLLSFRGFKSQILALSYRLNHSPKRTRARHCLKLQTAVVWDVANTLAFISAIRHRPHSCIHQLTAWLLFVSCLTTQQHASVSQGRICSDSCTCCHTEIEVADQTFYLTQSQYTDTGLTSPSADPIMPGAWQGSHWTANF